MNGLRLGRQHAPPGAPTDLLAVRDEALQLDPDDVDVLVVFALAANGGELTREALAAADRAIELAPDHARAHYVRGLVLYRLQRPEDALEAIAGSIVLMGVDTPQDDIGQQLSRIARGPGLAERLAAIAREQPAAERDWLLGLLPN